MLKLSTYIDYSKETNDKDTKLKTDDIVRIPKYENIFARDSLVLNWSEELFWLKKVKNTVPSTYVICDLKGEKIFGTFYEKKQIKKHLELKK